jgi:hypothetical protein
MGRVVDVREALPAKLYLVTIYVYPERGAALNNNINEGWCAFSVVWFFMSGYR